VDSHVKERIVGAAVLVALGVWLIPWVLDGPESEPATAATPELQLPSPDSAAPIRTETVELAARVAGLPDERDAGATDAATGQPTAVVRTTPAAAGPAQQPVAAAAPPAPIAEGNGLAAWSVQVGAFSERANAVQLAGRVAEFGHEARVSEFPSNGRTMFRVRVEGFATRERAEAAGSALAAHGFPGRVYPPD
jgi:cell division septation protein DedD